MSEFLPGLSHLHLPEMYRVRQEFAGPSVADPAQTVREQLARPEIAGTLRPGLRAAIAVGSRGIADLLILVKTLIEELRARGVEPFIVPSMGSHGGATAYGQRAVLGRYGIDDQHVGAPIRSAMEVDEIGRLVHDGDGYRASIANETGIPINVDRLAWREADLIIPVARIKPHTGFRGQIESGICKMLAIGLAKHDGCARLHREGYSRFAALIPAAAKIVLATRRIPFALAVVENARERLALIEAVCADHVLVREPELLRQARALMPRILLPTVDVLVVEEIGKDISGVGMDANVIGRSELGRLPGFDGPEIARIVVVGLSTDTHGNATGIGMADVITSKVFDAIDRVITYTNVLTSGSLAGGKIPVVMPTEREAILAAASCVPGIAVGDARMVRIRNTLDLSEIAVSKNLLPSVEKTEGLTLANRLGDGERL